MIDHLGTGRCWLVSVKFVRLRCLLTSNNIWLNIDVLSKYPFQTSRNSTSETIMNERTGMFLSWDDYTMKFIWWFYLAPSKFNATIIEWNQIHRMYGISLLIMRLRNTSYCPRMIWICIFGLSSSVCKQTREWILNVKLSAYLFHWIPWKKTNNAIGYIHQIYVNTNKI